MSQREWLTLLRRVEQGDQNFYHLTIAVVRMTYHNRFIIKDERRVERRRYDDQK